MAELIEWIKIVGGIAGMAALIWRLIDEFGSYLRISVSVQAPIQGWATALTSVDNRSNRSKKLFYAFLLIAPEAEEPIETGKLLAASAKLDVSLIYTNDLEKLRLDKPLYVNGRALIPLRFYYEENVVIGDETLTYRVPINVAQLENALPYAVRFFVFPGRRLHRSTHDCFINIEPQRP